MHSKFSTKSTDCYYTIEQNKDKFRIFYNEQKLRGDLDRFMISEKDSMGKAQALAKQLTNAFNYGFMHGIDN